MGNRLSRIYTRTGDDGTSALGDGTRVPKDDPRIAAYGAVDELNSLIGLIQATDGPAAVHTCLAEVQQSLFDLGGELSVPGYRLIDDSRTAWLEIWLDHFNAGLPPLADFVLPGGNLPASTCHVARTVCRRAERAMVGLARHSAVNPASLSFINRLSDLLFVIARVLARRDSGEVLWQKERERPLPR